MTEEPELRRTPYPDQLLFMLVLLFEPIAEKQINEKISEKLLVKKILENH